MNFPTTPSPTAPNPMEPRTIRYETEAMHFMRSLLAIQGYSDADVDIFKACLVTLERQGFQLLKKENR